MSILYLDTSALVKQYVQEAGSEPVMDLIRKADHAGTSLISRAEMSAALARAARLKVLSAGAAHAAWEQFLGDWPALTRLNVSRQIVDRAAMLVWDFPLRGYDAVHLASALLWQETLETEILLATFDRELWSAARRAGLSVWPETLPAR
ncbi:MAG: type II toxin-antitoxin system VapC family toxin [Anaerolineales bacterium]|nr:type II toxin-antitoxin system VapC family toxin [Anaerolineales bacterium]WKZ40491.1 MAG: type II toxin-antitoxin system VapC family toxin [Anaerolineales bacterium]